MKKYLIIFYFLVIIISLILLTSALGFTSGANDEERVMRELVLLSKPQAASPMEYEMAIYIADEMRKLGINVRHKPMAWEQLDALLWFDRDQWDFATWAYGARPERLDPDELLYNKLHSSLWEVGDNQSAYSNPEYDKVIEKQRVTIDKEERKKLVYQAQEIFAKDAGYIFLVHAIIHHVYNNQVFKPESIKNMAGMGLRNFWTFVYAEPAGEQKDFIVNTNDDINQITPLHISGIVDAWLTELIWDRLMRMDVNGLAAPWAAEKVEWITDDQVKITLRENMKWHDGKPVTVEDIKFSFEVPLSGEVPMYKPFVENIKSINIVDNKTLIFTLKKPSASFEAASLAKLNLVPKHIWEPIIEKLKDSLDNAESVTEKEGDIRIGSGPYKFSSWKFSEEVIFEANKEHFAAPKMDRWIIRVVPNMEAALGMIQTGEINFLMRYVGDIQLLKQIVDKDPKLTIEPSIDLGVTFVLPNYRRVPFNDAAFRRAIASVTDRDFIAAAIWKGFAVPADSVISPVMEYWKNKNLDYPSGGVEQAKEILRDAGYEWDKEGRLMYPKGQKEELTPVQ